MTAMRSSSWVFSSLHLPRPLEVSAVLALLARLAADRDAPRVVLEARATSTGIRYLLGCDPAAIHNIRHLVGSLVPGSVLTGLDGEPRADVDAAAHLTLTPRGLPLGQSDPQATTVAILSALATPLKAGEQLVLQIVVGPRRPPALIRKDAPDSSTTWLQALTTGQRSAPPEVLARLREQASTGGFRLAIRIGATSPDRPRRRRLAVGLMSALATAQGPGARLGLVRDDPRQLNDARLPWRWPLQLSIGELVGLLGWPLGDGALPGLPAPHPKRLRAHPDVHSGPRVFAESAAPGDRRQLGIAPEDMTYHCALYGPSGSGKSNALLHLILADIAAGRPVAVLDPKRQLVDDVLARIPDDRIGDVVVLDASDPQPPGFNPLDTSGRDPDVVVDGIMAVFEAIFSDGWGPRTSDILSASLRTLARAATPDRPATLTDIPRLLTDSAFRRSQVGRVQADIGLAGFWAWFDSQSPAAQAAAIAPPLNKLRQLMLRPALTRMLDQRDVRFRLRDIWRENKVVLIPLNESLIGSGTAELLGSLVISELWLAAQERAGEPEPSKRPGMVYVDEAPRFLHLPVSLADALAVSRSLGICWGTAAQFRGQFPPALRSAVDMNARNKIVFATEHEDARDIAKLSPELSAEDFMALPKYHAYVNLVAGGHPSGWAMVKTLQPPPRTTDPEAVRRASRERYGPAESPASTATPEEPSRDSAPPGAGTPQRIGRRRRRQL
jgi:hypothetical protein